MKSATFRLSAQETILSNTAYTGDYMIDSRIDLFAFSRETFFNGRDVRVHMEINKSPLLRIQNHAKFMAMDQKRANTA